MKTIDEAIDKLMASRASDFKVSLPAKEVLGQLIRRVFVNWANEQENAPEAWKVPYNSLPDNYKELSDRQGEELAYFGALSAVYALEDGTPANSCKSTMVPLTFKEADLFAAAMMEFCKKHNVQESTAKRLISRMGTAAGRDLSQIKYVVDKKSGCPGQPNRVKPVKKQFKGKPKAPVKKSVGLHSRVSK